MRLNDSAMQMFQRGDKDAQEQLMPNRYTSDLEAAGAPKPELQLTCWVPSKCSTWRFCIYSSGDVSLKLTEVIARSLLDKAAMFAMM